MFKVFEDDDAALEHPVACRLEQLKKVKTSTLSVEVFNMAEDTIFDKSWGGSPKNVLYRWAVKHNFNISCKSKNKLPFIFL